MSSATPTLRPPRLPTPAAAVSSIPPAWPVGLSRSVLFRLLMVAVAAVFTVHLAAALVIAGMESRAAEGGLEERVSTLLDSRVKLMAAPLWKMQYENLAAMLRELVSDPAIVSGSVYDDTGAVVATTGPTERHDATLTRT